MLETMLAVGGMGLNLFAIPSVVDTDAVIPRLQSVPTTLILFAFFTLPYFLLGMVLPAVTTFIGGCMWAFIAFRRN